MKVTAKASFIHGPITFKRGATVEVSDITGKALLNAGLVREATEKKEVKPTTRATGSRASRSARTENTAGDSTAKATGDQDEGTGVSAAAPDQGAAQD